MLTPSNLTGLDFINKRNLTTKSDLISQDQGQILFGDINYYILSWQTWDILLLFYHIKIQFLIWLVHLCNLHSYLSKSLSKLTFGHVQDHPAMPNWSWLFKFTTYESFEYLSFSTKKSCGSCSEFLLICSNSKVTVINSLVVVKIAVLFSSKTSEEVRNLLISLFIYIQSHFFCLRIQNLN